MSLRMLAGPFDITDREGNPPEFLSAVMWWPTVGMILDVDFAYRSVMTMDGIFEHITTNRPDLLSYWPEKYVALTVGGLAGGPEYQYDRRTMTRQRTGPDDVDGVWPYAYLRLADRRLYTQGYFMHGVVNGIDTLEGPEFPFLPEVVRPGRYAEEAWVPGYVTGDSLGCFYNALQHTIEPYPGTKLAPGELWQPFIYHLGMESLAFCYAPEYGVFVSIHGPAIFADPMNPWQVRIWSLEVDPFQLGPIAASVGDIVQQGRLVHFEVQLVGAADEPCANELVDWTLTVGSAGTLMDPQTKTNQTGYAKTRVLVGVTETGTVDVTATVRC